MIDLRDLRDHGLNYSDEQVAAAQDEIKALVDKLPSWRNAVDEVPPDMKTVLVWRATSPGSEDSIRAGLFGGYGFGWHSKSYGWYAGDHGANDAAKQGLIFVTHWMPLPEAPQ